MINNLLPSDEEVLIIECEMKENIINGVKEVSKFTLKLEAKICKMEAAETFQKRFGETSPVQIQQKRKRKARKKILDL